MGETTVQVGRPRSGIEPRSPGLGSIIACGHAREPGPSMGR
jgi:hypothetical protein